MNKFFTLSLKKQKTIINAALLEFGKTGYKKTSVNDIATSAEISKAMIFHYFESKKNMYLYLIDFSTNIIYKAFEENYDKSITDFFDRIMLATKIKLSILKKHPAILSFLGSVYLETDPQVKHEIQKIFSQGESFRNDLIFTGIDSSKFKDSVDPKIVLKILIKFTEGYIGSTHIDETFNLEKIIEEFTECMNLMKNNFYKEEYL